MRKSSHPQLNTRIDFSLSTCWSHCSTWTGPNGSLPSRPQTVPSSGGHIPQTLATKPSEYQGNAQRLHVWWLERWMSVNVLQPPGLGSKNELLRWGGLRRRAAEWWRVSRRPAALGGSARARLGRGWAQWWRVGAVWGQCVGRAWDLKKKVRGNAAFRGRTKQEQTAPRWTRPGRPSPKWTKLVEKVEGCADSHEIILQMNEQQCFKLILLNFLLHLPLLLKKTNKTKHLIVTFL